MSDSIGTIAALQDNNRSSLKSGLPAREMEKVLKPSASNAVTTSEKETPLSREQIVTAANDIQKDMDSLKGKGTSVQFQIDEELDRVIVRVVDRDSQKVIRQLPPEEVLRTARMLREMRDDQQAKGKNWREEGGAQALEGLLLQGKV